MKLLHGNALDKLTELDNNSIDAVITDPPYQLDSIAKPRPDQQGDKAVPFSRVQSQSGFMGKKWDVLPSIEIWENVFRAMKPGAFALIMCTPRQDSYMKMLINLEQAGFNIGFTSLYHCYASGFPKALNVGRKVKEFDGWYGGCQLKPAVEIIIVCQKPMTEKTYANQALASLDNDKVGKGCVNVDGCRIPYGNENDKNKATSLRPNAENHAKNSVHGDFMESLGVTSDRGSKKGVFQLIY